MRSRAKWLIGGGVLVVWAIVCLTMVGFGTAFNRPPVREISPKKARRVFQMVTGEALPQSVEDLRAIYWDSRDPAVFVRFKTDADGIAYIRQVFGGPQVESYTFDEEKLRSQDAAGWRPFWQLQAAEEKWGIPDLFDIRSLKSGLSIETTVSHEHGSHSDFRTCRILIDTEDNIVYVYAIYF